jgi:hypothetical protein
VRRKSSLEVLRNEIVSLEERALYMADLANCLPDHQDWLWRAHDRLRREGERFKRLLADAESRRKACAL